MTQDRYMEGYSAQQRGLDKMYKHDAAPRGTYWPGNSDDISVPEMKARGDIGTINELISKWEGELAQSFLMSNVRDAEALEQRMENERMEHNQIHDEREGVKARICDQYGELDVDSLVEVLHELGVKGW